MVAKRLMAAATTATILAALFSVSPASAHGRHRDKRHGANESTLESSEESPSGSEDPSDDGPNRRGRGRRGSREGQQEQHGCRYMWTCVNGQWQWAWVSW
jgi:hypothetical protein